MTLQLGQPVPDGGQYVLDVFISNAGKPPCSIPQQPGVQLVNDDTAANPRASLDVAASGAGAGARPRRARDRNWQCRGKAPSSPR